MENDNKTIDEFIRDKQNWKLGLFYFNRADKRTIVPSRRKGLGPTLNFASSYTILLLFGTIALVILMDIIPNFIAGK